MTQIAVSMGKGMLRHIETIIKASRHSI